MNPLPHTITDLQIGNAHNHLFPRVEVYGFVQKKLPEWVSARWLYRRITNKMVKNFSEMADELEKNTIRFQEAIDDCNFDLDEEFDPDGTLIPILEKAEETGKRALECYRELLADLNPSLASRLIQQTERLCRITEEELVLVQDFRWKILIHNGALSPDEDEFCHSAAEFRAALHELRP